ncbi:MAG TPA: MBL fold metallo-hydrolase RNA specificity domain-containing protein [Chloroflexota bacterium]|nr:MBL fold metallo-hydrolase RNA specificity domain-containing protein [Chloroflexota bacterium]
MIFLRQLGSRSCHLFSFSDYVNLDEISLALDPPRRCDYAFVSHGHSDHVARHPAGLASPATVALVQRRYKSSGLTPLDFGETRLRGNHRLWLVPAGHVLGAAQLVVDRPDGRRLIYTGDFSMRPRLTVPAATPVQTDVLIMECTYGSPRYVFPPDDEICARIRFFVERALDDGVTPVLLGYSLGKAQEAMALINRLGYPVIVHPTIAELADVYQRFGVEIGSYQVLNGPVSPGHVLIAPPSARRDRLPAHCRTLYLSGWALDHSTVYRLGVDEAVPLSDHADFSELIRFVEAVQPSHIYTTHGPPSFADYLRRLGFNAQPLGEHQLALL